MRIYFGQKNRNLWFGAIGAHISTLKIDSRIYFPYLFSVSNSIYFPYLLVSISGIPYLFSVSIFRIY